MSRSFRKMGRAGELGKLFKRHARASSQPNPKRRALRIENLESRQLLTVVGPGQADDGGEIGQLAGAAKFFVVDAGERGTFSYDGLGEYVQRTSLDGLNLRPRGIASNQAGNRKWVIDADRTGPNVFVYDGQGQALGFLRPVDYYRGKPEAMYAVRRQKLAEARHRRRETNLQFRQPTLPLPSEESVA